MKYYTYTCYKCGWTYDEATGDPRKGFPAGTKWEDLPEDYRCHECDIRKRDSHMWKKSD